MNPLFFNYGTDTSLVASIAKPSAIIVTGRGNRYDPNFQKGRVLGALVYAYINTINIPVGSKNPQDLEQWMGDTTKVPRWKFHGTGPVRSNWPGTELVDIRPGSAYRVHARKHYGELIAGGKFDGFFCDDTGVRPWAADWESWPVAEQVAWGECMLDIARELHELRVEINPRFELVHNNLWDLPGGHPLDAKAQEGDRYCNGVCLENTPPDRKVLEDTGKRVRAQYHINYAARTFAGGVYPRRLLSITNHPEMRDQWKADPNVTHITYLDKSKGEDYMRPTPAIVPYKPDSTPAPVDPHVAEIAELQRQLSAARATITEVNNRIDEEEHKNAALEEANADLKTANEGLTKSLGNLDARLEQIAALATR